MARIRRNTITCEHPLGCTNTVEEVAHELAHSMLVVLQKVDHTGFSFYQCNRGARVDFHNWQHWHCSHEHAKEGVKYCIATHHHPRYLQKPKEGTSNLHAIVFESDLTCVFCSKPLTSEAYRFCLTYATPYNDIVGYAHDEFSGWCCNYEHAVDIALEVLRNYEPK